MKPAVRSGLAILLGTFVTLTLIALPALAYQYPLSSIDIRDAFLIGNRNDDLTAALFAKYSRTLPAPETGPYVAQIELDTPYLQIARRAKGALNYDSLDAVQAPYYARPAGSPDEARAPCYAQPADLPDAVPQRCFLSLADAAHCFPDAHSHSECSAAVRCSRSRAAHSPGEAESPPYLPERSLPRPLQHREKLRAWALLQ